MKVMPMKEVEEHLAPVAHSVGAELLEAVWNNRERSLTLVIDAPGGVDLNLCEAFHHAADAALDELDPTYGEAYTLNCSSPGLDRPFKDARDFARHLGEKIEVHLYAPYAGAKYHEGTLVSFEGGVILLNTPKGEISIPFDKTSKVCLLIEV